ncbi:MAG: hypothetical protein V4649_18240 [Bacteroidota bacterium]
MKKLSTAILFSFTCLLLASCERKEYTCTCRVDQGGHTTYQAFELGKMSRNTAQDKCNDKQLSLQNTGIAASCKTE